MVVEYKDPSLQNIAKKHRDILRPDLNKSFGYIDYDQYEAGIMAALSGDPKLLSLYSDGDMYEALALQLFSDINKRKHAKRLFLSYAYGMRRQTLVDAAVGYGANRNYAKYLFNGFTIFEDWKKTIWEKFEADGRIGTTFGNFLMRERSGQLTGQEQRSAVSQVIQGTASLIFKLALLSLSKQPEIELILPMHDAALVQIPNDYDISLLPRMLADTMSDYFDNKVVGKASIQEFCLT
ncbi:DNA polymerase [Thiorhodococcus fuscus]|uniref:DNA polymerase n=1 Tax=Thiorhodococcus fuscus TaxID=527200 RepID=A0ABW4Y8K5_9GAMM